MPPKKRSASETLEPHGIPSKIRLISTSLPSSERTAEAAPNLDPSSDEEPNTGPQKTLTRQETITAIHNITSDLFVLRDAINQNQQTVTSQLAEIIKAVKTKDNGRPELETRASPESDVTADDIQAGAVNSTNGTPLHAFIQEHFEWIDQALLINIVSKKMEIKDLIKLIPEEDRPSKGRPTAGLATGIHIDTASGKVQAVGESLNTHEKDIPDLKILLYILSIYGAIRSLYDIEHTGIGAAIIYFTTHLIKWDRVDGYQFKHTRAYFIGHFRKYQRSSNSNDWMKIDEQLFIKHMRSPLETTPFPSSPNKRRDTGSSQPQTCRNYNDEQKGCSFPTCYRRHICSTCNDDHPAFKCPKRGNKHSN